MKSWWQSKTIWTGITGVVAAVAGYFTGELELSAALQIALTGLVGIFLRDGMLAATHDAGK